MPNAMGKGQRVKTNIFLHIFVVWEGYFLFTNIQSNLDGSNTDGSFTMATSNSFLVPTKFFRQPKKTNI